MRHVRVLGWVWIGVSSLVTAAALAGMVYFLTAGNDEKTAGELLFLAVGSVFGIPGGIGILRGRQWGRILLLVVGALSFMAVPVGTALGAYTYWVLLFHEESAAAFRQTRGR